MYGPSYFGTHFQKTVACAITPIVGSPVQSYIYGGGKMFYNNGHYYSPGQIDLIATYISYNTVVSCQYTLDGSTWLTGIVH